MSLHQDITHTLCIRMGLICEKLVLEIFLNRAPSYIESDEKSRKFQLFGNWARPSMHSTANWSTDRSPRCRLLLSFSQAAEFPFGAALQAHFSCFLHSASAAGVTLFRYVFGQMSSSVARIREVRKLLLLLYVKVVSIPFFGCSSGVQDHSKVLLACRVLVVEKETFPIDTTHFHLLSKQGSHNSFNSAQQLKIRQKV